jgi:hypothetical protein
MLSFHVARFDGQKWIYYAYEQQHYTPMLGQEDCKLSRIEALSRCSHSGGSASVLEHSYLWQMLPPWMSICHIGMTPLSRSLTYACYFDGYGVETLQVCPWGGVMDFLAPPKPKTKGKLAAFFASNCVHGGAKERTEYVAELMKYMPVDSFGGCLHNKDDEASRADKHWSNGEEQKMKIETISEYKFLLAFENSDLVRRSLSPCLQHLG